MKLPPEIELALLRVNPTPFMRHICERVFEVTGYEAALGLCRAWSRGVGQ